MGATNKKRTTVTVDPEIHNWWKKNSSIPLSKFLEDKMREVSASADKRNKKLLLETKRSSFNINLDNLEWANGDKNE